MPSYQLVFKRLASRAVQQGGIDVTTFVEQNLDAGVPNERILQLLEQDLDNNGPIFGKFLRSMVGASQATITTAGRQGKLIGAISSDDALQELLGYADGTGQSLLERAMESADPELASTIEDASADVLEEMWVATLVNTCHLCLPLHGKIRTRSEWRELGLLPELMHEGWNSSCQCQLVPMQHIDRATAMQPLVRTRQQVESGKRTMRAVLQGDIDRAQTAIAKAIDSEEGRRVLRLLGEANADKGDN